MTDTTVSTEQAPAEQTEAVQEQETQETPARDDLESLRSELSDWKGHARKHEDRAKALVRERDELAARLAKAEETAGQVDDLTARATAAEERAQRAMTAAEVASEKGVQLRYVIGDTREEMEAAADRFLADARASFVGSRGGDGSVDSIPRPSSMETGRAWAEQYLAQHKN